ncbi:MAG: hypothetical protein ACTHKQ_25980 [Mesorhizobium sp.]
MTPAQHLNRYPQARSSTLAYLIRREQLHEQMRRENAARRRRERFERFLRIVGMGRKGAA